MVKKNFRKSEGNGMDLIETVVENSTFFKERINMDKVLHGFPEVSAQAGPSADRKHYQCYQF